MEIETQQQAFERIAPGHGVASLETFKNRPNAYKYAFTSAQWGFFQAAYAAGELAARTAPPKPVGYGVFWEEKGMQCSKLSVNECEVLEFAASNLKGFVAAIDPIYRGTAK